MAILNPRDIGHLHFPISWPSSSICDKSIGFGFIVSFAHFNVQSNRKVGINASGGVRGRLRVGAGVARIEYNRIACGFSAVNFICKDKFFEALVVSAALCLY